MTTPTLNSAYPADVETLLPRARKLAEREGAVPSIRSLMDTYRIGYAKAKELREALETAPETAPETPAETATETAPETAPETPTPRQPETVSNTQPETPAPAVAEPLPATPPETHPSELSNAAAGVLHAFAKRISNGPAKPASEQPIPFPETPRKPVRRWWLGPLSLGAFIAIWSGWVGLGEMTGFGVVHPLPGILDSFTINTAITLPIGVETYAAFALRVWIAGAVPTRARKFAKRSAIGSLVLGALGQIAYHLLVALGTTTAPWWLTAAVSTLPVAVLGMGAALFHLMQADR